MSVAGKWFGFNVDPTYDEALRHYHAGEFQKASELFLACEAGTNDPTIQHLANDFAVQSLIMAAEDPALGPKQSTTFLEMASDLRPEFPDIHFKKALAYLKASEYEAALTSVNHAIDLQSGYQNALLLREIIMAYQSGSNDIEQMETILKSRLEDVTEQIQNAKNLLRSQRYAEAADACEKILNIKPNYADVRCLFGQVLMEMNQVDIAMLQLDLALSINPKYVEAHAQKGICLKRMSRNAEAKEAFAAAYALDPHHPIASLEVGRR